MNEKKRLTLWHRTSGLLLAGALIAGLLSPGCSKHTEGEAGKEGAEASASPVPVQVATAAPQTLQPVLHLTGRVTLDPGKVASISAPFEGVVQAIVAEEGQHVAKDAPIVQMDHRPAEYEAAKAGAVLAKTRAATNLLKAGPRPEDIEVARQDVVGRETELESLNVQLKAKEELRQKNMISPMEFDDAQRKVQGAKAALKAAKAKVDILTKGPRPEEVTEAEEELQAAIADDAMARLRLDRSTAKAPIEGELVKVTVHPGMALAVAAPIAEIVDLRQVLAESVIPLSRLAEVKIGGTAHITTAGYPDQSFEGKVVRISHQAEPDTGNVPVWIGVDNPEQLLRQDMVVRVALDAAAVDAKVVIPESAIIELDGQLIVMVIHDGKTHNAPVKVGRRVDGKVEIVEGLAAGEQVITSGGYGLPEDHPVTVEEASTQAAASQHAD